MGCVFDCLESCGATNLPNVDGEISAPFVELTLGRTITVGNRSSPPDNYAVIKSFQYGASTGQGVEVEIVDQEGGSFSNFMRRFSKNPSDTDSEMKVKYGWITTYCNGGSRRIESPDLRFLAKNVKAAYEGGKIKFNITGVDLFTRLAVVVSDKNQGSDDAKRPLKVAIANILRESSPPVKKVSYLRKNSQGQVQPWKKFNVGDEQGPMGVWKPQYMNPIDAIREWIKAFRTDENKGITIEWDCQEGNHLILWEDTTDLRPTNCLRQYIVNSGACSNVISFNLDAEWTFYERATKGTSGVGSSGKAELHQELNNRYPNDKNTSINSYAKPSENLTQVYSQSEVGKQSVLGDIAHQRAAKRLEGKSNVSGQLTILGDPFLADPKLLKGAFVSIIVVNPFHIGENGTTCGDWLAKPICNPDLTSNAWMVDEVNHQIREGSFTTILKVSCQECLGGPPE